MSVLCALGILVAVLNDAELQFLHRLADTRGVGQGGHRVGGDQPEPLDLARLNGVVDVSLEHAALFREKLHIHVPEFCDLLAVCRILQRPVVGQAGAGGPLAGAHGVALTGDGEAGTAGFADVAGKQGEVVDPHHAVGAVGRLVDTHGPDLHRRPGIGEAPGNVTDGVLVDATDLGGGDRVVIFHLGAQLLDTVGVGLDVGLVLQPLLENHVHQGVLQHHIGTRGYRQVQVGILGQHGDPRIDHDERKIALLLGLLHPPVDDRVLLRQVGAPGDQTVGMLKILVAPRWSIGAEGALVTGDRRGHAQRGVAVVVIGADQPAGQLAQGVELLGQHLAGGDHRKGVTAILSLNIHDRIMGPVEGAIPVAVLPRLMPLLTDLGRQATAGRVKQFMLKDPFQTELATIDIGLRHATGGHRLTPGIQPHLDGTAG